MVRPRKTKAEQARRLKPRHVLVAVAGAVVIAAGLTAWQWLRTADLGPRLTTLVVSGDLRRVDPAALRAAVKPMLGGGFFRVNLDGIRARVLALPWVADAAVRLEWPATLKIDVREQRAIARWDDDALINAGGIVFAHAVPADLDKLPALSGPDDTTAPQVLAAYQKMNAELAADRLSLAALSLDARGAWIARLGDGLELRLGREQPFKELARFVEIVPRVLGGRYAEAAYIDMRYTNGFAVGWKSTPATKGAGNA